MSTGSPVVPAHLSGLVDDEAVLPPGNAPLEEALTSHLGHRRAPYADLVGPLVVGDDDLQRLVELVSRLPPDPHVPGVGVAVVVAGGAGAIAPAVHWATRDALRLRSLEITVRESDAGEPSGSARRIVTALDRLVATGDLDDEVAVYVEPPPLRAATPTASWLDALDQVATMDHRLRLRTGGADPDSFPSPTELATCIGAALDRELRFKCTAGLHRAVRHRDPDTGIERHGFLNVLVATRASLDGAARDDVAAVLEERDPQVLRGSCDDVGLAGAHRWFTSFGTCSVSEPLEDLRGLGMLG